MSKALQPALALALALGGCAAQAPPAAGLPAELRSCPGRVHSPPAPRAPRTVEAIARWATAINDALVRTEAARAECARRLARAVAWIESQP